MTTPDTPCRAELFYQHGTSDKVYIVDLRQEGTSKGWIVEASFGRRGGAMSGLRKTDRPCSWMVAEAIFRRLVDEKLKKGYTLKVRPAVITPTEAQARQQALSWLLEAAE